MVDEWLDENIDQICANPKSKTEITYHEKMALKEKLLQEAEKLTHDMNLRRKYRNLDMCNDKVKGKQDFFGRNLFVEEAIEKNYSALVSREYK